MAEQEKLEISLSRLGDVFQQTAEAIRVRGQTSNKLRATDFAAAILAIPSGGGSSDETLPYTINTLSTESFSDTILGSFILDQWYFYNGDSISEIIIEDENLINPLEIDKHNYYIKFTEDENDLILNIIAGDNVSINSISINDISLTLLSDFFKIRKFSTDNISVLSDLSIVIGGNFILNTNEYSDLLISNNDAYNGKLSEPLLTRYTVNYTLPSDPDYNTIFNSILGITDRESELRTFNSIYLTYDNLNLNANIVTGSNYYDLYIKDETDSEFTYMETYSVPQDDRPETLTLPIGKYLNTLYNPTMKFNVRGERYFDKFSNEISGVFPELADFQLITDSIQVPTYVEWNTAANVEYYNIYSYDVFLENKEFIERIDNTANILQFTDSTILSDLSVGAIGCEAVSSNYLIKPEICEFNRCRMLSFENLAPTYSFELDENGYYKTNSPKNVSKEYVLCKFSFYIDEVHDLILNCNIDSYTQANYAVIGKVDEELSLSYNISDDYGKLIRSFQYSSIRTFKSTISNILKGNHFIEIKFIKVNSSWSGNECFSFKPEFIRKG